MKYKVKMVVQSNGKPKILAAECDKTCPAGKSGCCRVMVAMVIRKLDEISRNKKVQPRNRLVNVFDFSGTADALPRLDYKLRNDYGIFCFRQALTPPPPRSISKNFLKTDLDRFQLLRNFQSFFKAVHSPLTT